MFTRWFCHRVRWRAASRMTRSRRAARTKAAAARCRRWRHVVDPMTSCGRLSPRSGRIPASLSRDERDEPVPRESQPVRVASTAGNARCVSRCGSFWRATVSASDPGAAASDRAGGDAFEVEGRPQPRRAITTRGRRPPPRRRVPVVLRSPRTPSRIPCRSRARDGSTPIHPTRREGGDASDPVADRSRRRCASRQTARAQTAEPSPRQGRAGRGTWKAPVATHE